jgi:cysteine desulfurase/selenocysteine lyase
MMKVCMETSVEHIRKQFPILAATVYGKPLAYLDNAATTQKPAAVVDAIKDYYNTYNSNIHRGVHFLSQMATERFEAVRESVRDFINASAAREIIFTRGATESVNMVASAFGRTFIREGDEVLVTMMEHHSNFVPWQAMCRERGAHFKVVPVTPEGELSMDELARQLSPKTRVLALTHVSNALGTVNPVGEITALAHGAGARVLIDGAQAIPHLPVDVAGLDCDFYCFSGHKMYGPTGIGVLYGKAELLEAMPPYQYGGEMISEVGLQETTYNELPFKFEAGTPDIAGVIGLGAAIRFIVETGYEAFARHEEYLMEHAIQALKAVEGIRVIGNPEHRVGVVSFVMEGTHPYDVGVIADKLGIALRTGHLCAQPLMEYLGLTGGTIRASFALYNTIGEVGRMADALGRARNMLL